jgi:tetratricopeptide (TPR) repeat protein
MTLLLLGLVVAAADPCAPVEALGAGDPAAAAAYRAVGDAERSAGSPETATVAYRAALARDPADVGSRRALEGLCAGAGGVFQRGLARMEAGDLRGAIADFREARARGPDPAAALVQGVCHYELGQDAEARASLREAAAAPAHREAAEFYLGLIALREGDGEDAARLLDAAAANPGFAPAASDLARLARRSGTLVFSALAESGWDSNAQLAPGATPIATSSDGSLGASMTGLYRPLGASGPYLRATGLYHGQARYGDLDVGGVSAAAGWQLGGGGRGLIGEYDYDYRLLGGSSFLSAHRFLAAGWWPAGPLTLGGSYYVRLESYPAALYAPFSGSLQRAELNVTLAIGSRGRLTVGYHGARDGVEQSEFSWTEHGPGAELRVALAPRWRLTVDTAMSLREHDAVDPALGLKRSDAYLDAAALVEWDLDERFTLRLALDGRKAFSNAASFEYVRVAPTLGLAYVFGL